MQKLFAGLIYLSGILAFSDLYGQSILIQQEQSDNLGFISSESDSTLLVLSKPNWTQAPIYQLALYNHALEQQWVSKLEQLPKSRELLDVGQVGNEFWVFYLETDNKKKAVTLLRERYDLAGKQKEGRTPLMESGISFSIRNPFRLWQQGNDRIIVSAQCRTPGAAYSDKTSDLSYQVLGAGGAVVDKGVVKLPFLPADCTILQVRAHERKLYVMYLLDSPSNKDYSTLVGGGDLKRNNNYMLAVQEFSTETTRHYQIATEEGARRIKSLDFAISHDQRLIFAGFAGGGAPEAVLFSSMPINDLPSRLPLTYIDLSQTLAKPLAAQKSLTGNFAYSEAIIESDGSVVMTVEEYTRPTSRMGSPESGFSLFSEGIGFGLSILSRQPQFVDYNFFNASIVRLSAAGAVTAYQVLEKTQKGPYEDKSLFRLMHDGSFNGFYRSSSAADSKGIYHATAPRSGGPVVQTQIMPYFKLNDVFLPQACVRLNRNACILSFYRAEDKAVVVVKYTLAP